MSDEGVLNPTERSQIEGQERGGGMKKKFCGRKKPDGCAYQRQRHKA